MAVRSPVILPPIKAPEELQKLVAKALDEIEFEAAVASGELIITVPSATVLDACRRLKANDNLQMTYLRCLSGVDQTEGFEVVYHLYSVSRRQKMVLKARVSKEEPKIASVVSVWKGADWHEREAAEMFGIVFEGHPHLISLLLVDGFEGHPLLKSFKLDDVPADLGETNANRD